MAFSLSPAVTFSEEDLTNVVAAVSTSVGAAAVEAAWGPVEDPIQIDSENTLVKIFGKPNTQNAANWFTAANFLAYSNNMYVIRTDSPDQLNAVTELTYTVSDININDPGIDYANGNTDVIISAPDQAGGIQATATVTVSPTGEIEDIQIIEPGTGYNSPPSVTIIDTRDPVIGTGATATANVEQRGVKIKNKADYDAYFANGQFDVGAFAARYPGSLGNSISVSMADSSNFGTWEYKGYFNIAPGTSDYASGFSVTEDEIHIVVIDRDGNWSGTAGAVLETFAFLSKAKGAKKEDGTNAYWKDAINETSAYVYAISQPAGMNNWGLVPTDNTVSPSYDLLMAETTYNLQGGSDDFTIDTSRRARAFGIIADPDRFDISLVMAGKADRVMMRWLIDNIAETRRDCVVFGSPQNISTGEPIMDVDPNAVTNTIEYRNGNGADEASLPSSSYYFLDSGYKYQYDIYNDVYRWIPLNGDIAGLFARTDQTNDPWFSAAGFNRGQVKNVVKLAFNPTKAARDLLYQNAVNPVVSFRGEGVVLYGDKTGLTKPSAFDRINVRRLFIVLEKAIATSAKYQQFEFNDAYTRANFVAMVEPYLRTVQGRRGITSFKVVCDETNNTQDVIDHNQFFGEIMVAPARSINFIHLTFTATRTGSDFTERVYSA